MELKTKRIILRSFINFFKLVAFSVTFAFYGYWVIVLSKYLTDDYWLSFAFLLLPAIIACVWDISKNQVERQMHDEQRVINILSKEY